MCICYRSLSLVITSKTHTHPFIISALRRMLPQKCSTMRLRLMLLPLSAFSILLMGTMLTALSDSKKNNLYCGTVPSSGF